MPQIIIKELDNTTSMAPYRASDTVCIFGVTGKGTGPQYLALDGGDVRKFEEIIGKSPAVCYELENEKVYDIGYIMAKELVAAGMNVLYVYAATTYDIEEKLSDILETLKDKGEYDIKFIMPGVYSLDDIDSMRDNVHATAFSTFAEARGDCVALLSLDVADVSTYTSPDSSYAATFVGTGSYNRATSDTGITPAIKTFVAPAAFGYLLAYAKSLRDMNPNWLAIAGVNRGLVPNLVKDSMEFISNTKANEWQPRTVNDNAGVSLNAITNIKPYGLTIWGNRTTKKVGDDGVVAGNMLNLRNMVNDVKKLCYTTAKSCLFEQDTEVLWLGFKAKVSELLDRMKSGNGISGYKFIRENTTENATICAKIVLYPTYAVENFEITVVLENAEVTVE